MLRLRLLSWSFRQYAYSIYSQTDRQRHKEGRETDRQSCAIFDHFRTPQAEWKLQKQRQVGTRHPRSASIDSVITIDRTARAGLCQRVTIVLIVPIKTLMSSTGISQVSVPAVLRHVALSSSYTSHLFVAVLPLPPLYPFHRPYLLPLPPPPSPFPNHTLCLASALCPPPPSLLK